MIHSIWGASTVLAKAPTTRRSERVFKKWLSISATIPKNLQLLLTAQVFAIRQLAACHVKRQRNEMEV